MKVPAKYYCDICGVEITAANTGHEILVLHTVEDEEGGSCKPYVTHEEFDLCDACLLKATNVKVGYRNTNPSIIREG